jgi:hypothetical protein
VNSAPLRGVIALLTGQALAFGVMLALLVIPANALFLDAYGAKWLPATYIAIAVVGTGASALVARAARRTRLVSVATVSLLALAILYFVSWLILLAGGVWVSTVLLVLFPIALQMGFVFIGGQAGRLLDVRQLKERFPRIITGFSLGFLLGGLLGIPLLSLFGSTEHLLVATTLAQLAFLGLLLVTERRYPEVRAAPAAAAPAQDASRPPARVLFASGLVLLLLTYQVLSAMGSQLLDYLLFNRAQARYSGDQLTRFLSWYTAGLNLADILFLALVAGLLMRRFGLRLGLVLNPVVVCALLIASAAVAAGPGVATLGLFTLVATARLADIVLTDGTTRTSVNASFQVVPISERLAVQAVVEGIGVPIAIGATGAVILIMNVAGLSVGAVIAFGVVLAVVWTATGFAMYRSYTRALADEMRRSPLPAGGVAIEDDAALQRLLASEDARDVRLGLDLLAGAASPGAADALRHAADHADPDVRMRSLLQLAAEGDAAAADEAGRLAEELARSAMPADRRAAAIALAAAGVVRSRRELLVPLLEDADPAVRSAALDAVAAADVADPDVARCVTAAAGQPRTAGSAAAALRRVGAPGVPLLAAALAQDGGRRRPAVLRAAAEHGVDVIRPALDDPDRAVVAQALEALAAAGGSAPPELLDRVFGDAAAHASRAVTARDALAGRDDSLRRALDDELDLARRLVVAVLTLRHGDGVRAAVRVVDRADGQRQALGVEALDVLITREEATVALPLVRRDLTPDGQPARPPDDWLRDLADDPDGVWRSSWLAACARHAARR